METSKKKTYHRPKRRFNRRTVAASIDEPVKQTLDMLGFDIPALIEEMLNTIADHKKCPVCHRIVRPVIVARELD